MRVMPVWHAAIFRCVMASWIPHRADFSGFHPKARIAQSIGRHTNKQRGIGNNALVASGGGGCGIFGFGDFCAGAFFRRAARGKIGRRFIIIAIDNATAPVGIVVVLLRLPVLAALAHNAIAALLVINVAYLAKR